MNSESVYSKSNPYLASIKDRFNLCKPGSHKNVYHVVLDIKGSGLKYDVGDSIAVFGSFSSELVEKTLKAMRASGEEIILEKRSNESMSLREFLTRKGDINQVTKKLISTIAERQTNEMKKDRLSKLLLEENKDVLKEYIKGREVWDVLEENGEVQLSSQDVCHMLQPLLPRFYSIASSMQEVGEEIHLTVSELQYVSNGHLRKGICTHYLCQMAPLGENSIPIYVQPQHGFTLPEDASKAIIMVGPGTGVAPFRAFLQERQTLGAKGFNWLFFGECYRDYNFFYQEYFEQLVSQGFLRLDTAFSRDQEHKIYVQHRLLEFGAEVFKLLEQGAILYVCGDALRMAKDVEAALHRIIEEQGNFSELEAKQYVKRLRAEKRYLRDVY